MKFLIDTNIFLNVLKANEPASQVNSSLEFFKLVKYGNIENFISPIVLTELFRIPIRNNSREEQEKIWSFLEALGTKVLSIGQKEAFEAAKLIESSKINFADALVVSPALTNKLNILVTRNKRDYRNLKIDVFSPEEAIGLIK